MGRAVHPHIITDDSALGGNVIERSLRFVDARLTFLTRTPSSTSNRRTWTFSVWLKHSLISSGRANTFFCSGTNNPDTIIKIDNDRFEISRYGGSYQTRVTSKALLRDPSAWYHFVGAVDTTQGTASDRVKLYINGTQVTDFDESTYPSQNYEYPEMNNSGTPVYIGRHGHPTTQNFEGYITEFNFIDGLQLDPSYFGQTEFQTGIWRPKKVTGITYGTNGFYLPFKHTATFTDFFDESSSKHLLTRTGDVIHTSDQKKNGATSIYFDDSSDTLNTVDSSDFTFGTNDFTIEAYVRRTRQGDDEWFFIQSDGTSANTSIGLHFWSSSYGDVNKPTMRMRIGGSNYDTNGTTVTVANTWYHIAGVRQGNTFRIYVNGVQEGTTTNSGAIHDPTTPFIIGAVTAGGSAGLKGYMDQVRISNVCRYPDGTSFTPPTAQFTSDSNTKLLVQSNIVHHVGTDASGNHNDYTPNNLKTSDAVKDTPTNNFCTQNPLDEDNPSTSTFSEANLQMTRGTNHGNSRGTMGMSSGKWYFEYCCPTATSSSASPWFGVCNSTADMTVQRTDGMWNYGASSGQFLVRGSGNSSTTDMGGGVIPAGTVIGVAVDMDNKKIWLGKSNTWYGSTGSATDGNPNTGANPTDTFTDSEIPDGNLYPQMGVYNYTPKANFGQDSSFSGTLVAQGNTDENGIGDFYYAPPSGFLALCSNNLSPNVPSITSPQKHFKCVTWTGNTTAPRDITGIGFAPDLVSIKARVNTYEFLWFDTVRGAGKRIYTHSTAAESDNQNTLNGFISDGFRLGSGSGVDLSVNGSASSTYVAWCWKAGGAAVTNNNGSVASQVSANQEAGFSIVTYNGSNDSTVTFGHGLDSAPELVWIKRRNNANGWRVYHHSIGLGKYLSVSNNNGETTSSEDFASVSATTFGVKGGYNPVSINGGTYVAYCWHSVPGYSKIGSFTGNGNANGPFVYTGFRPAYILFKNSNTSTNWEVYDTTRPYGKYNPALRPLYANRNYVEETNSSLPALDILNDGFKPRSTWDEFNKSSSPILYMAFAEQPGTTSYDTQANAR
tara:strand:+ start:243 stop:3410 length:3168 start_codon:yes stop_codon:yes gene_type:complete